MSGEQEVEKMETDIAANGRVDRSVRGWLPIETVPKDGSAVLVWLEEPLHNCRVVNATFRRNITIIGGCFHFDAPKATHWMAPPEAPNAALTERGDGK